VIKVYKLSNRSFDSSIEHSFHEPEIQLVSVDFRRAGCIVSAMRFVFEDKLLLCCLQDLGSRPCYFKLWDLQTMRCIHEFGESDVSFDKLFQCQILQAQALSEAIRDIWNAV